MNERPIKTRFAPSPTGLVHLGNARTALFNALFARGQGGIFLLRIEDTDAERSRGEYVDAVQEDLRWLGLDWQEGPGADGGLGPYIQSQRTELYNEYYQQLEASGAAYPCFCTATELEISRKIQRASGKPPKYSGTCAHLQPSEIERKRAQGLQPTLRFRVQRQDKIDFTDLVRGAQAYSGEDIGDFIIRRADGSPAFFFCNAIDDATMAVTHVLRGEDHLTNTPRQLLILRALGLPEPHYGHISLITGADGAPLSKRHGSQSLRELRTGGYAAIGVANYLARLGHAYENASVPGQDGLQSLEELAAAFRLERLSRSPARFDAQHLHHWQQAAIHAMPAEALWSWLGAATHELVPSAQRQAFIVTVQPNLRFPADALAWAKIFFTRDWPMEEEAQQSITQAGAAFFTHAIHALDAHGLDWPALSAAVKTASGCKGKALFMPLRAALTGTSHGPEMAAILALLGTEETHRRLVELS